MAGEYYRWLARNEKPREKRELTPGEKRRNWWAYHKWYVILAIVCAVVLAHVIQDAVRTRQDKPDYIIAYVGQDPLPEALAISVEEGLAALGEDLNGNGEVRVEVRQFRIAPDTGTENAMILGPMGLGQDSSLQLQSNIEMVESMVFLLEDPAAFQSQFPILSRADGSLPDQTPDSPVPLFYSWAHCPALTELELAPIEVIGEDSMVTLDPQEALAGLYVARRGLWEEKTGTAIDGGIALWLRMTAGAQG